MAAGIPHDMRRTALVSLAAHVAVLFAVSSIALVKTPPKGASSMQVMLVSRPVVSPPKPEAVAKPQPAPAPPVKKTVIEPPSKPAPVKAEPVKPTVAPPPPVPVQARPKVEAPVIAKPAPVRPKQDLSEFNDALNRAEEALKQTAVVPAGKPAASAPVKPRTSEEINKLLGQLPPAVAASQETRPSPPAKPEPARPPAPATAAVAPATPGVPQPAAVERCPPKARAYCPLLEAAINRLWNSDTDPVVRNILENSGDSTATIRIVIQPDGGIRDIRLNKSSGNEAYDRAVQSLLRDLRHLPPLPEEMQGETFTAVTSFTYVKKRES